jgi:hypothetical protein
MTILMMADDVTDFAEEDESSWPDAKTAHLIDLWKSKPWLYETTHKWYSTREKKLGAMTLIAKELKMTGRLLNSLISIKAT